MKKLSNIYTKVIIKIDIIVSLLEVMLYSVDHLTFNTMVNFCKLILQHVKEYCEQAAIHGPQHIVSERLSRLERLVITSDSDLTVPTLLLHKVQVRVQVHWWNLPKREEEQIQIFSSEVPYCIDIVRVRLDH